MVTLLNSTNTILLTSSSFEENNAELQLFSRAINWIGNAGRDIGREIARPFQESGNIGNLFEPESFSSSGNFGYMRHRMININDPNYHKDPENYLILIGDIGRSGGAGNAYMGTLPR